MKPAGIARAVASVTTVLLAIIGQAGAQEAIRETAGAFPQEVSTSLIRGIAAVEVGASPAGPDIVLVTNRPVEVLAAPSSSASLLYGFPAGRSVRLIDRDGGFAQIQDLNSSATGWIDDSALVQSSAVDSPVPSIRTPARHNQKAVTASSEQDQGLLKPKPGLQKFKGTGDLRPNGRQRPLSGLLVGLFGR
jgi:hypothetical protein